MQTMFPFPPRRVLAEALWHGFLEAPHSRLIADDTGGTGPEHL